MSSLFPAFGEVIDVICEIMPCCIISIDWLDNEVSAKHKTSGQIYFVRLHDISVKFRTRLLLTFGDNNIDHNYFRQLTIANIYFWYYFLSWGNSYLGQCRKKITWSVEFHMIFLFILFMSGVFVFLIYRLFCL